MSTARPVGREMALALGLGLVLAAGALLLYWRGASKRAVPAQTVRAQPSAVGEVERGVGLMGQFEFEQAAESFAAAEAAAPEWWVPKYDRAVATLNQTAEGAQQHAIELLGKLASSPEADTRARYCTGLAQLFLGQPAAALPLFVAAANAEPNDAYAQFYTGQCLELTGDLPGARGRYERAIELDPLMRSSYLGLQRTAARLNDEKAASAALASFEALSEDPRSTLAEFKYTRMGPLSAAIVEELAARDGAMEQTAARRPEVRVRLNVFGEVTPMQLSGLPADFPSNTLSHATTVDLNGDQLQDVVFAATPDAPGLVCMGTPEGGWRAEPAHPLARVQARGLLWADLDNDGRVDAVVNPSPDSGSPYALYQNGSARWTPTAIPTAPGQRVLALADLDHDGDVDMVTAFHGKVILLMNRSDGTFEARELREPDADPAQDGEILRATVADADGDGDVDLVLVRVTEHGPQVQIWVSRPFWRWHRDTSREPSGYSAAAVAFRGFDGRTTLLALLYCQNDWNVPDGVVTWDPSSGAYPPQFSNPVSGARDLTVCDAAGLGEPLAIVTCEQPANEGGGVSVRVFQMDGRALQTVDLPGVKQAASATPVVLGAEGLQFLIPAAQAGEPPRLLGPGTDRRKAAVVDFRGRTDPSQQMRSNASGIGTAYAARASGRWVGGVTGPHTTAGGGLQQSLEPEVIGLGVAPAASFVSIVWPDGVTQSELDIGHGMRTIVETQRQISSCPVIFAWNGREYRFVTDCLGVGGMGYLVGAERGEGGAISPTYAPPRPWERVVIGGADSLAPRNGALEVRVGEPMEEACYLDAARLVAYDLPEGWTLALDERMGIHGPEPTGEPRPYRDAMLPKRATVGARDAAHARDATQARNATTALAARDGAAADLGLADPRFIGRLATEATLDLEFPVPIDSHAGAPMLLLDGWVEYPYCQTNFAMWQSGAPYEAPTFEALDPATGAWVELVREYGYPAGMPREACFPLPADKLPSGCTTLRLRTTMEIYVDRAQVAWCEPCPALVRTLAPLAGAECAFCGFPKRIARPQRRPDYAYADRAPLWDCRLQFGAYTAYGDCTPLLAATDDAVAIFGAGEEIRLRFLPPPAASVGTHRTWVLETDGWCKDMDRYTGEGKRLAPLPLRGVNAGAPTAPNRDALHAQFNTRFAGGR